MAALETPWLDLMSPTSSLQGDGNVQKQPGDTQAPAVAAFSPVSISHASSANKQRSTILVHQKSPLLISTPPQITRALAYSHPFLLPLNKVVGLLTWTTGDPWESFLLLAGFWATVLYGDVIMRYAGPVVVVVGLILGMYSRRYSPLSSTGWTGEKQKQTKSHKRVESEITSLKHQKTLDEIVETLKVFTSRCNILLDPLLHLTDFLSTQRTATSATTRPALTTLFIRILLITPFWAILSLPPIRVINTKRIALVSGTIFFTWHSRPAQVSRAILWRSSLVRRISSALTGLDFPVNGIFYTKAEDDRPPLPPRHTSGSHQEASLAAAAAAKRRPDSGGVKFTFILYENQRRWVGLGWTTSLFGYERAAWTDEHNNAAPSLDAFELPEVEGADAQWRWVAGSKWRVDGAGETEEGGKHAKEGADGGQGWIYYDNKWQNGRRGVDGWGKYTRRRKWYRDAELVEVTPSASATPKPKTKPQPSGIDGLAELASEPVARTRQSVDLSDSISINSLKSEGSASGKSSGFRGRVNTNGSLRSKASRLSQDFNGDEMIGRRGTGESEWGIGDDARMGLE